MYQMVRPLQYFVSCLVDLHCLNHGCKNHVYNLNCEITHSNSLLIMLTEMEKIIMAWQIYFQLRLCHFTMPLTAEIAINLKQNKF